MTRPSDLLPPHEARDQGKLTALVAAMQADGWIGAPIVAAGDQALTGSHRIAAAEAAKLDEIPTVDVADLLAEQGQSWCDLVEEMAECGASTPWYEVACRLGDHLPADIIAHYGLDMH